MTITLRALLPVTPRPPHLAKETAGRPLDARRGDVGGRVPGVCFGLVRLVSLERQRHEPHDPIRAHLELRRLAAAVGFSPALLFRTPAVVIASMYAR